MRLLVTSIIITTFLPLNLLSNSDEQEIKELRTQVQKIMKRLDYLENKVANKKKTLIVKSEDKSDKLTKKPIVEDVMQTKNNLELKTADTVLSIGGRIELNTHFKWPDGTPHTKTGIPIANTAGEDGHITFDATQSRLWIKTRTSSKYGMIRTLIETDFAGSAKGNELNTNSSGPRLRHAYVNIANLSIGQTNSAFNTFVPLDIIYTPVNDLFVRQPLIRYSSKFSNLVNYDISFEQPETTLLDQSGTMITPKDDIIPDIITRLRYYPSWGELGFSLMGRYINQDNAVSNTKDSALGLATNMSAKVMLGNGDDIRLGAVYGKGLGRYIGYSAYPAGTVDANGNIKLQETYGGQIGYRHWWSKELRSTIALLYAGTDNNTKDLSSADLDDINKDVISSQINLLWTPVKNSLVGVEYLRATRKVESGKEGDIDSAMLHMKYDF